MKLDGLLQGTEIQTLYGVGPKIGIKRAALLSGDVFDLEVPKWQPPG